MAKLAVYGALAFSVPLMAGAVWYWPSLALEVVQRIFVWTSAPLHGPLILLSVATLVLVLPVGAIASRRRALRSGRPLARSIAMAGLAIGLSSLLYAAGLMFTFAAVYD